MRGRPKQLSATLSPAALLLERKRATKAIQSLGEHFRVHAHTDSEVVRHFEEAARLGRGFEFHSQPFEKRVGLAPATAGQAHK